MDDVDRLFQCFKCGVSPPQSAIRERKKEKRKLRLKDSEQEASSCNATSSSTSAEKSWEVSEDVQLYNQNDESSADRRKTIAKGKQFSPVVFYGSPNGVPPKRPARLLRLLHEIRIDLAEQNKLREEVWATYPRQEEAMKYVKEQPFARVFSYQDHMTGQRRFLASTYKEFWRRYKCMNPKFRHHYEVIQEGLPCHLYFDLEFSKRDNTNRNGDNMVELLLLVVFDVLLEKYSIHGDHDCVVELDSSTEDKFSRHLIIRLPKTAFKDNSHVGAFVAEVCSRIYSLKERDKRFEDLFVSKGSSSADVPLQLFVDTAVYTRNRCFRLPLSSKAGKSSVLLPSGRSKSKDMSEEEMFMASLICRMDADCEKLLICKMDLDCVKALQFDAEVTGGFQNHAGILRKFDLNCSATDASRTYLMGKSPFLALDLFIESVASIGNVPVIYVVDLRRADYYQKCHDPDCRGYRSPLRPIPDDVVPDSTNFLNLAGENECQGHSTLAIDESITDSCKKEGWWLEAIRVADQLENMRKTLDLNGDFSVLPTHDETGEEDDEWWMAVERTASQTELTYFQQA